MEREYIVFSSQRQNLRQLSLYSIVAESFLVGPNASSQFLLFLSSVKGVYQGCQLQTHFNVKLLIKLFFSKFYGRSLSLPCKQKATSTLKKKIKKLASRPSLSLQQKFKGRCISSWRRDESRPNNLLAIQV